MYYNIDSALSYNALFTMIMGGRGIGKTYSAKKRAIKNFLAKGEQFVYLRRYKTELKKSVPTFFADVAKEFPDHQFKATAKGLYIDEQLAGFCMTLSTQIVEKSTAYPGVTLIIFEEFLIDPSSSYHYLRNEVETFLEAYSTVARDRDVRVVFLANNVSLYNPYLLYFGLQLVGEQTVACLLYTSCCWHFLPYSPILVISAMLTVFAMKMVKYVFTNCLQNVHSLFIVCSHMQPVGVVYCKHRERERAPGV